MAEHIQTELARYLMRSALFRRRVRDSHFKEWQKRARSAAWKNVVWNWSDLGVSETARAVADSLEFVPSEVFAHPEIISADPELADYYRLMACISKKGMGQITSAAVRNDPLVLCRFLNGFLSSLLVLTAEASRESLLNTIFAEAGSEWQGIWANLIGAEAAKTLEQFLTSYAEEKELLDTSATATLNKTKRGIVLKSGTTLRCGSEPDVECRDKDRVLICVIEIKGSTDKAGAQTRLGETKKSFTKAKLENPRCHTIFLPSVLTPAVKEQLKTERDIDQVFDLLAIIRDEEKRAGFLEELFKFRLREKIQPG
jgi:hypothetical protein